MTGIYRIKSPSNKVYIGQSWNISKRIVHYKTSISKCCKGTGKYKLFTVGGYVWKYKDGK